MQSDGDKLLAFKRLWFKSQPCVVASNIIKYTMETFSSQMYESTLEGVNMLCQEFLIRKW